MKSNFTCNVTFWGSDPLKGIGKACFIKNSLVLPKPGFTTCANENQRCSFSGVKDVDYGAYDKWTGPQLSVLNGINCNNSVFGRDPYPGVGKICAYKDSPNDPPPGYAFCAKEGNYCSLPFNGLTKQVAYGAYRKFVYRTTYYGFTCNNSYFGSDPFPGVAKTCYVKK